MRCPFCGVLDSRVIDSRVVNEGDSIRRRRECSECGRRFTTYEKLEDIPLLIIKRDGRREVFDRSKLIRGLARAGEKRPVTLETWDKLVNKVEQELRCGQGNEIPSEYIGEQVLRHLAEIDQVAYVRFASVYRKFTSIDDFKTELDNLRTRDESENLEISKKAMNNNDSRV